MKVTKQIHRMWLEGKRILDNEELTPEQRTVFKKMQKNFGKYQWIYETEKGQISLISLPNYFYDGINLWEIYCLKGDLFPDIMRFDTKPQAIRKIKELLE